MLAFRLRGAFIVLGGVLAFFCPIVEPVPAKAQDGASALKPVHDRYSNIRSVYMKAEGRALVALQGADSPSTATFAMSYWADGSKFRLNYRSNGVQGLLGNRQAAFDGDAVQRLDEASALLVFTTRPIRQTLVAGPNPLFLPLLFLTPNSVECPLCDIRLPDLVQSSQWDAARVSTGSPSQVFLRPQAADDPWSYQVSLDRMGTSVVPIMVQRKDQSGKVLVQVTAKDFRDFGSPVGMIPMAIETQSVDDDGRVDSRGSWKITDLQINVAIEPSLFRISPDSAEIVLDDDSGIFLKHPQSRMVGHSMKDLADMPTPEK